MLISEFVGIHRRQLIPVFVEEKVYQKDRQIIRSNFAIMYSRKHDDFFGVSWEAGGFGISENEIHDRCVVLKTAQDFYNLHASADGWSEKFISGFANLVGDDTVKEAFNRLLNPLNAYHKATEPQKLASESKRTKSFTLFNKVYSFVKDTSVPLTTSYSFYITKKRVEAKAVSFDTLLPIFRNYSVTIIDTVKSTLRRGERVVSWEQIGGTLVPSIQHIDSLYYLHLLKEQEIRNNTWKHRIKKLFRFGKVKRTVSLVKDPDATTESTAENRHSLEYTRKPAYTIQTLPRSTGLDRR